MKKITNIKVNQEQVKEKLAKSKNVRILLFTLILLSEIFALINSNFLSSYNLVSIGQSLAPYAILSLGAIFPIALGFTDLSTGAVCIAAAVVAGKLYALGMPLWMVIPCMILFGTLVGFINGLLISKFSLPPFIVTLGTMMFIRGVAALFANQPNVLFPTGSWYNQVFSSLHGIPIGFAWVAVFGIAVSWFFKKSKPGRHMLAVGSSEKAAIIAGLNSNHLKIAVFTISGMMAGIAAILWSSSFATVTVATGNGMELDAIAGAYIGGCAAAGGSVSSLGTIIGAALLVVLRNGLNFVLAKLNIPLNSTYVTFAITGIIVVLAVFLDKTKERRKDRVEARRSGVVQTYVLPAIAFLLAIVMIVSNIFVFQKQADTKKVAVLMKSEGNAFWDSVTQGAKDAAAEAGYELIIRGPQSEDSSQLPVQRDLFNVMLSENPIGIGISTIANGFTDLLEEANRRNIPLVQYDSGLYADDLAQIEKSENNPLRSFVKGDNYQNAALLAESVFQSLRQEIASSDDYVIGIIQHEDSIPAGDRSAGFKDQFMELAEADAATKGKCRVEVEVKPGGSSTAYKEGLEALFEKGAKHIFMTAEIIINQVYDAVSASGDKYDGVTFSGYDSGQKALQWLQSDSKAVYLCGVSQNPYNMGRMTVETLIKIQNGETVDPNIVVPGVVYNRENCEELLEQMVIS